MKQYTAKQLANMLTVRIKRNEADYEKKTKIDDDPNSYTHSKTRGRGGVCYWSSSKIKPSAEKRINRLEQKMADTMQEILELTVKLATVCDTYKRACEVFNSAVMTALGYGEGWDLEDILVDACLSGLLDADDVDKLMHK